MNIIWRVCLNPRALINIALSIGRKPSSEHRHHRWNGNAAFIRYLIKCRQKKGQSSDELYLRKLLASMKINAFLLVNTHFKRNKNKKWAVIIDKRNWVLGLIHLRELHYSCSTVGCISWKVWDRVWIEAKILQNRAFPRVWRPTGLKGYRIIAACHDVHPSTCTDTP